MNSKQETRKTSKTFRLFLAAALLAGLMWGLAPARPAHAATIVVNTTDDEYDTDPAECSLREAIQAANTDAAFGSCTAGSGDDTITLPAGTYLLTIAGAGANNATGDLNFYTNITLNGAGASSTIIDGNQLDRVIWVAGGDTATLNGVTITNGKGPNGTHVNCGGGGAHNEGTLTIQNSIISSNTVGYITGSSDTNDGCWGGGVYSDHALTIENTVIRDNTAGDANGSHNGGPGGGVYVYDGTADIRNSTVSGNATGTGSGAKDGGGVYNGQYSDGMTIENTTINNNTAGEMGGGVYNNKGTLTIKNSTISDNTAAEQGGGAYNSFGGTLNIEHSTITANTAGDWGGGIDRNTGTVNLKNSIVAGNNGSPDTYDDCRGTITSQGYNLVGAGTGCPNGDNDQTTSDAKLGALADNGGPTETHALLHDSPAVEAIPLDDGSNNTGCGTDYISDQRGETRPQGGLCDVGAYESPYIIWDGGGGGDTNTSTAANWSGNATPAATDIPVFDSTSSNNATVDANLTTGGWLIASTYGGSISQGSSSLTVNGDWTQSGGAFSGGSGVLDLGGAFDLSGGTFTALSGLMTVSGGFHHTGGTFDPNGGRVVLDNTSDQTLATTFYDLTLNDGLLGYWKLDEGAGSAAADSSGYGHDGTLNGGPAWITDTASTVDFYDPYALHLDRSPADYVNIPGTTEIDNLQELTLSAWVRLDTTPADANMRFITLRNEKAVLRYKDVGGTGKLQFYMDIGGLQNFEVNHTWAAVTWYHVAGTYDGSTMRLYLDGVEQPGAVSASGTVTTGNGVHLGWSGSDGALNGLLDDVRIYNRALSGTDIQALADGEHPNTSQATTTLGAALDVNGDLTLNSGTLDVSASNYGINLAGSFTYNGGVFTPQSGTVTFDGASPQNVDAAGLSFNDLTVNSGATLVDLSGLDVDGTLTNNGTLQRTRDVNGSSGVEFFTTGGYGGVTINAMNSDLGSTVVKIHGNQDCTTTASETVQRCFEISPENTTGRVAFIRFYFALSELSGNSCETLEAYHGTGGNNWEQLTRDPGYWGDGRSCTGEGWGPPYGVAVREVSDFSPFVLKSGGAPAGGPTAVTLASFTARPAGGVNGFVLPLVLVALGAVGLLVLRARRRR